MSERVTHGIQQEAEEWEVAQSQRQKGGKLQVRAPLNGRGCLAVL